MTLPSERANVVGNPKPELNHRPYTIRSARFPARLADSFYDDFQPANAIEAGLLDNIIRDTWLAARFARIDAEILDYKIQEALFKKPETRAGRAFLDSGAD